MNFFRSLIILSLVILVYLAYSSNITTDVINLINENIDKIKLFSKSNPFILEIVFFILYILVAALSLPFSLILGLLSGMIFDIYHAIVLVSFASSIGATFAFLLSRYLLSDYIKRKYKSNFDTINKGFEKHNNLYIFALRMCVLFPFFLINILLGLTSTRILNFYIVSQIGMLPATIIIIHLGNSLSDSFLKNVGLSLDIIILLTILGLIPIMSKIIFRKIIE